MIKDTYASKLKTKPPKDHGIPVIICCPDKLNTLDKGNKFQSFTNASSKQSLVHKSKFIVHVKQYNCEA